MALVRRTKSRNRLAGSARRSSGLKAKSRPKVLTYKLRTK